MLVYIAKGDKEGVGKLLGDWAHHMIVDPEDETTDEHEKRKRAKSFRNRQIMALEIPTFCNMSKVMFYDVLMKLSHQTVKLYLEKDELKAM